MDYSILVVSCDKYVNLLDVFFKYFKINYKADGIKTYLSMENIQYINNDVDITVITNSDAKSWSHRLKEALKKIDSKAVLLLLDDFIIESAVDTAEMEKLAKLINEDDKIAHFALTTVPMKNASQEIFYDRYYKRHQFGRYKTTLQAGMWNKDELMTVLNDKENPWRVEVYANMRSFLSEREYYAIADKKFKPIDYNDGYFCLGGKINELEIERLKAKFGEDLHVDGIESNHGIPKRRNTKLLRRCVNRSKIILCYWYYRFLYWRKNIGKKN